MFRHQISLQSAEKRKKVKELVVENFVYICGENPEASFTKANIYHTKAHISLDWSSFRLTCTDTDNIGNTLLSRILSGDQGGWQQHKTQNGKK